jgi:hypothetical protein
MLTDQSWSLLFVGHIALENGNMRTSSLLKLKYTNGFQKVFEMLFGCIMDPK